MMKGGSEDPREDKEEKNIHVNLVVCFEVADKLDSKEDDGRGNWRTPDLSWFEEENEDNEEDDKGDGWRTSLVVCPVPIAPMPVTQHQFVLRRPL